MKINVDGITFNIETDETLSGKNLTPLLFLHGYTGSSLEWKRFFGSLSRKFLPFAIDLPGHGETDSPADLNFYTSSSLSYQIAEILTRLEFNKVIICGYSMGGRAALSFYASRPDMVSGLILESTTPGIIEPRLRDERVYSDSILAKKIEEEGVEKFGSYWLNLPMFDSLKTLPEEEYAKILKSRIHNNAVGLINSLKGFGTGSMPQLWDSLRNISFPVLLITGEYDSKFTGINIEMKERILKSSHHIIKECGHNTHLEKPDYFINLVNNYLYDNFF
jgi:2-succinyl-6-hydroxy-2,4-cyclohexadiene-1-carboxylate synthase